MTTEPQVIDANPALTVASKYEITRDKIVAVTDEAKAITVKDHTDHAGMQAARKTRLVLREMRVAVEKRRKELKADALAYGRNVDAVAKELAGLIEPDEKRLKELEETAKREADRLEAIAKAERAKETTRRVGLLASIGEFWHPDMVAAMPLDDFEARYADLKAAWDEALAEKQRIAEEEAAERARLESQRREQEAEAERIAAERRELEEAKAAILRERAASRLRQLAEFQTTADPQEIAAASDEEFAAMLDAARIAHEDRQEAARIKAEEAQARAIEQAKADEAKRLAAEEARKAAEAKAIEDERAKAAAAAPVREKLKKYGTAIGLVALPTGLKKATREQLIAARQVFLDELAAIAAKL